MRRRKIRQQNKGKIIFLCLLNLAFVLSLVVGLSRISLIYQEKDLQKKIDQVIAKEKKEITVNEQRQTGMIGSCYVEAFYPLSNGQVSEKAKEVILADSKSISNDKKKDNKISNLTFYHTTDKETNLANVKEILINRTDYMVKQAQVKETSKKQISSIYLNQSGELISLDKIFKDADKAKENFLEEIESQLTFRQTAEQQQNEILNYFKETEFSQWSFRFENSHFSIALPQAVQELTSLDIPLTALMSQINPDYLLGADLEAYHHYEEQRHEKVVALTFDDGPDSRTTPQALAILKKYHVKATFFMIGQNIAGNENLVKQVHDEGHQIGIHTWSHPVLTNLPLEQAKKEINDTQAAIGNVIGTKPTITRPPYGAVNATVQNAVNQSFIMWDVDSLDWKSHNTKAIMQEVAKTKAGSIILMHDIHQTTIDALPSVIEYLQKNNYTLVTVDELLQGQLEPHQIYYRRN